MTETHLSTLFREFPFTFGDTFDGDPLVSSVTADSRQVQAGSLFVAVSGGAADGHNFIPDAIRRGAVAVVGEQPLVDLPAPYVLVENARQSLAYLASAFYGYPARKLTMIGITGTDGKTTTSNMLYSILKGAGLKAGMITTVNAVVGDRVLDTGFHVTTPDAPEVQRYLSEMVAAGLTHVILETTSHGWAQYRVDACEFDIAVVTNITHEHLDYHGSYEAYRQAKARLFIGLETTLPKAQGNPRLGVLNRDDRSFEYLDQVFTGRKATYGLGPDAEVRAENIRYTPAGIVFDVMGPDFRLWVKCSLAGAFNVSNSLAAISAAIFGLGIDPQAAAEGICTLSGVPGRMELIDMGQPFTALVDFAHTPNALKAALQTGKQMTDGRVIAVFGSAGLRDKQKRRLMAGVSAQFADLTILTAEDPRIDPLEDILAEMALGAEAGGGEEGVTFWRIRDRGEAIRFALREARPGDLVMACGKGHEQSMCFETTEYAWDDRTAVRAALAEQLGVEGPAMPYLPTSDGTYTK